MVHVDGDQGNARLKAAKRENVLNHFPSLGGARKIYGDLPEPCTTHVQLMRQTNTMWIIAKTINFSLAPGTVGTVMVDTL